VFVYLRELQAQKAAGRTPLEPVV